MRHQRLVCSLLQARALAHEVKAKAGALARAPHLGVGQPDRRHELAPGELCQDPGVDPVGLAGKGSEPLGLLRVCDLDLPAMALESSCTKRALVIDSIAPTSGWPWRLRRRDNDASPSASGGAAPAAMRVPSLAST